MAIVLKTITFTIIFASVHSLERLQENSLVLNKIVQLLSNKAPVRRTVDVDPNKKTKRSKKSLKDFLRSHSGEIGDVTAAPEDRLAENELKLSLEHKKSALYDHPYVEHKGKKDFLVIGEGIFDHFVTVIPNSMYQQIEKRCVNWLDDCSLKGIRARLLRGVRSPYR